MKYAIDTLLIERARLVKTIREFESITDTGDNFPYGQFQHHERRLREIDKAISVLTDYASRESA